ncbi:hypothetical protein M0812_11195 [Anaeramoeba flamelloides]|uniref:Sulfatase N-terminal domain-containing protein n=1 Tax=Anaeramoeba flamelloides TaxID=1746091 RepID=A0AAV7ZYB3_9EUKA|nr:hypothetical protein M0812_11195 [Anaeramoeba flamelloides]
MGLGKYFPEFVIELYKRTPLFLLFNLLFFYGSEALFPMHTKTRIIVVILVSKLVLTPSVYLMIRGREGYLKRYKIFSYMKALKLKYLCVYVLFGCFITYIIFLIYTLLSLLLGTKIDKSFQVLPLGLGDLETKTILSFVFIWLISFPMALVPFYLIEEILMRGVVFEIALSLTRKRFVDGLLCFLSVSFFNLFLSLQTHWFDLGFTTNHKADFFMSCVMCFMVEMLCCGIYFTLRNPLVSTIVKVNCILLIRFQNNFLIRRPILLFVFTFLLFLVLLVVLRKSFYPVIRKKKNKKCDNDLENNNNNNNSSNNNSNNSNNYTDKENEKFSNDKNENTITESKKANYAFEEEKIIKPNYFSRSKRYPNFPLLVLFTALMFVTIIGLLTLFLFLTTEHHINEPDIGSCNSNPLTVYHSNTKTLSVNHCQDYLRIETRKFVYFGLNTGENMNQEPNYEVVNRRSIYHQMGSKRILLDVPKDPTEVIYVLCSTFMGERVQSVPILNHYNETFFKSNMKRKVDPQPALPPNVLLLQFDGASREPFHSSMQQTFKTLRGLHNGGEGPIKWFSFDGYRLTGMNSLPNQIPIYSGSKHSLPTKDKKWIWNLYKDKDNGYLTVFIDQICKINDDCQKAFGISPTRKPDQTPFDHRLLYPFCDNTWYPYLDSYAHCLNGVYGHSINFYYLNEIFSSQLYQQYRKFVISTFYSTHETSLKVAQSADNDLSNFLYTFFNNNSKKKNDNNININNNNTIVILFSDHGIHYGPFQEKYHKYPLFELIIPSGIINKFPDLEQTLTDNLHAKFFSKDIYHTLKHFLTYPDELNKPQGVYSLFETIPKRSCKDIRFYEKEYCEAWKK